MDTLEIKAPYPQQFEVILGKPHLPDDARSSVTLAQRFTHVLLWLREYLSALGPEERQCFVCRGAMPDAAYPIVLSQFMSRAMRLALPLVDLVGHGWGDSAALLTRCLIDLRLRVEWIGAADSGLRAWIHICAAMEERVRELRTVRKHGINVTPFGPPRTDKESEPFRLYKEARQSLDALLAAKAVEGGKKRRKGRVEIRSLLPPLRFMASHVGRLPLYDFWYGEFSIVEHNNLESLREHVRPALGGTAVTDLSLPPQWGLAALGCGIQQFTAILDQWRGVFGIPAAPHQAAELDALLADVKVELVRSGAMYD